MKLVIIGQLPRKSNSRRIVTNSATGKPMVIKSKEARDYEMDFEKQIPIRYRQKLDGHLEIKGTVYYRSNRSDLSIELLLDCLERSGVIINDRRIVRQEIYKKIDRKNPRVEIEIKELRGYILEDE